MIHVSNKPETPGNRRAFVVELELLGEKFCGALLPDLQKAFDNFIVDNEIAADLEPPALIMRVELDRKYSWYWQFVCARMDGRNVKIVAAYIIDKNDRHSTLRANLPKLFARLPPAISIDAYTVQLMTGMPQELIPKPK